MCVCVRVCACVCYRDGCTHCTRSSHCDTGQATGLRHVIQICAVDTVPADKAQEAIILAGSSIGRANFCVEGYLNSATGCNGGWGLGYSINQDE